MTIDDHLLKYFSHRDDIKLVLTSTIKAPVFDSSIKLEKRFRDGFWVHTSKRLFYLYYYIKRLNIINCVHIENDNMVYVNLNNFYKNEDKLMLIMDQVNRCVPSIIFIPNCKCMSDLLPINPDKTKRRIYI